MITKYSPVYTGLQNIAYSYTGDTTHTMCSQTRVLLLRQHAAVYIVDRPLLITEDVSTALM